MNLRFNGSTVREPWLSDSRPQRKRFKHALQWVHGSRTVVISPLRLLTNPGGIASMGPRFANRGYRSDLFTPPGDHRTSMGPRFGGVQLYSKRMILAQLPSAGGIPKVQLNDSC